MSAEPGGPAVERRHPRTAIDANVIIAGLASWHDHHAPARLVLADLRAGGQPVVLPAPALLEAYSVLTRLPTPMRLRPRDATRLLSHNFRSSSIVAGLEGPEHWPLLEGLAEVALGGGLVFDACILACARRAGARRLITFNRQDFERLPSTADIELLDPRERSSR